MKCKRRRHVYNHRKYFWFTFCEKLINGTYIRNSFWISYYVVFESICFCILFQVKWHITMDTGWPWQVVLDLWSGNPGRHHQQEVCQDLHSLHQHWRKDLRSLLRHPRGGNSQSLQCQQRWGYPHKEPLQQEHDSPVCQNLPTIHLCCWNSNPTEYPWM